MVVLGEKDIHGDVVELGVMDEGLLRVSPAHRPGDQCEGIRGLSVVAHGAQVELLQDTVDVPHVEGPPLGRRDTDYLHVTVLETQGIQPDGLVRGQVLHGDGPAELVARLDHVLRPVPLREVLRALLRRSPQGLRQLGHPPALPDRDEEAVGGVEVPPRREVGDGAEGGVEVAVLPGAHHRPLPSRPHRRLHERRPGLRPEPLKHRSQTRDEPRDAGGVIRGVGVGGGDPEVPRELGRGVHEVGPLRLRVPVQGHHGPRVVGLMDLVDRLHEASGHGGVDGVPTVPQDIQHHLGHRRVGAAHHRFLGPGHGFGSLVGQ